MKAWSIRAFALLLPMAAVAGVAQACLQSPLDSSKNAVKADGAVSAQAERQRSGTTQQAGAISTKPSSFPPTQTATAPTVAQASAPSASGSKVTVPPPTPLPSTTTAIPKAPASNAPAVSDPAANSPIKPAEQAAPDGPALRRLTAVPAGLGLDNQIFGSAGMQSDRDALIQAVDYSLDYLATDKAVDAYANYPIEGVSRDRVRRSLQRFKQLLQGSNSAQALQAAVRQEFDFYQATGTDGQGNVDFTGYFTPSYAASREATGEYRYPLYAKPGDLESWAEPHPDRIALEGKDGLKAAAGPLNGLELVWLKSRLEAFLVQVQGSARLQLTDGSTMSVGYAGRTNYPYVSVGKELVNDGIFTLEELTLPLMLDYFSRNPQALSEYLPRNPRFVFFEKTDGAPPMGSIAQPVTTDRSIATDKSLMPPGALTLISTQIPYANPGAVLSSRRYPKRAVNRFALDQDTGGAIKGAGRADIFLGTGSVAGDRAGLVNDAGQLYYLLLKDGR